MDALKRTARFEHAQVITIDGMRVEYADGFDWRARRTRR